MNTLNLSIYTNDTLEKKYEKIPYQEKQTFYYFEIDQTKYILSKDIHNLKYQTPEEKVTIDFKNQQVIIKLLKFAYQLNINIIKYSNELTESSYKITYVLDSEPDTKRTILLTLQ